MTFDKTKAMRNAEKYLSQGKIKLAIGEYKQVIEHDPKDYSTMNMLGDMYVKNAETGLAINCYRPVADHYNRQGFAQKAIAVYNKITRLDPGSIEVNEKLAELYRSKGSVLEARQHYKTIAEYYEKRGQKIEALAVWQEIAKLDPQNTTVYVTVAESYLREGQADEAAAAFVEAGRRFANLEDHATAVTYFERALELNRSDVKTLSEFVDAKCKLGEPQSAVDKLNEILEEQPHNRDAMLLIVECQIEARDAAAAERAVIRLVEQEPANYPKFLDVAYLYLENGDFNAATRILSMSSEHLLVGGQADSFHEMVSRILANDAEQLDALRLLARYRSWQKDEGALRDSLVRLAEAAQKAGSIDDERYALVQLVMYLPHETGYSSRLREINQQYGFDDTESTSVFDEKFIRSSPPANAFSDVEPETAVSVVADGFGAHNTQLVGANTDPFAISGTDLYDFQIENSSGQEHFEQDFAIVDAVEAPSNLNAADEVKLHTEVESIKFYIENGYTDLAKKAVAELAAAYGDLPQILELKRDIDTFSAFAGEGDVETVSVEMVEESEPAAEAVETPSDVFAMPPPQETAPATNGHLEPTPSVRPVQPAESAVNGRELFDLDDLRDELGIDEPDTATDDGDYDTHFHTAVAYQEMGLLDDAIKEFQEAVALVRPNDGTRRFFSCANLLGHCFMEKGMPSLALKWYERTLETNDLNDDEKQGLWYEIGNAHEADGDNENAGRYFEKVYAENIDFRDVSDRIKNLMVSQSA